MAAPLPARRGPPLRRFCVAALAALAGAAASGAAPYVPALEAPISQRQPFIVGAANDSFPYGYTDGDGRLTGFTYDLLDAVAAVMDLRIERVPLPGMSLQARFAAGEFDAVQSLSETADRARFADFSVPFLTLQGTVFVQRTGSPVRRLEDLSGRRFAIIGRASIAERFLDDRGLKVERVYVSSSEEALRLVEIGDCAGTFLAQLTALTLVERNRLRNVAMFGRPFPEYDIRHCFAVHKGDAVLLARLNEGLSTLHRSGDYSRIYRKWFGRFDAPMLTREQVVRWGLGALTLALAATVFAWLRQRTLRRRIEAQAAQLARQQDLLRTLYDNIPLAMCVLERKGEDWCILSVNLQAEPFVGVPATAAGGQRLRDLPADPEWAARVAGLFERSAGTRRLVREECHLPGARKRLILTLVPLATTADEAARYCVLAEDVTERRNLDEEIAKSRKLRAVGELVGGIAHEFNNLLTPVALSVSTLQADRPADAALQLETRVILEAVERASELTRRLLTFGRKSELQSEEVHLSTVVSTCFSLLRLTVDRRIVWENAAPTDLPPLHVNPTDLNQVILNLILNARDTLIDRLAVEQGGWTPLIRIEAAQVPATAGDEPAGRPSRRQILGWQRVTVRDNGMGMEPEVRERIFEPFFTTKDVGKGTGLGLATVWHLVTEVGGRIEVESKPGQGSAFHVFLPVFAAPEKRTGPRAVPTAAPRAAPSRIFLAEDDPLVASTVVAALGRAGHTLTHCPDGNAAWGRLRESMEAFDLLILDVNMPGIDGIELALRVRKSGRYKGRIMIASGCLSSSDLLQLAEAGVDHVANKPFNARELLEAVNHCLLGTGTAPPRDRPAA